MAVIEDLIAGIVTAAGASKLKLVALEMTELFSDPEVAKFSVAWFAGRASSGELRRRLKRDLLALAEYATKKMVEADAAGDLLLASRRMGVSNALGHLAAIVENGDRYGMRGGASNVQRFDERRRHTRMAFAALAQ